MSVYGKVSINETPISVEIGELREDISEIIPNSPIQITRAWMQLGIVYSRLTDEEIIFDAPEDWEERELNIKHLSTPQSDRLEVPADIQRKRDRQLIKKFIVRCERLFNRLVNKSTDHWVLSMMEKATMELMESELALYSNHLYSITANGITKTV